MLTSDTNNGDCYISHGAKVQPSGKGRGKGKGSGRRGSERGRTRQCTIPSANVILIEEDQAETAIITCDSRSSRGTSDCLTPSHSLRLLNQRTTTTAGTAAAAAATTTTPAVTDACLNNISSATKTRSKRRATKRGARPKSCSLQQAERDADATFSDALAFVENVVMSGGDRNVNASEDENEHVNVNSNAPRKQPAKAQRANVRTTAPTKWSRTRLMSLSNLKPTSAVCSQSGLGLIVTYRPVFSETTTTKRRPKKRTRSAPNAKHTVCHQDSGTNPRTPSPEKQRRLERDESFFGQIEAFSKRKPSPERRESVGNWLRNTPASTPRIRKRRSPTPRQGGHPSSFPWTATNRSARATPTQGPSWAPDELTEPRSGRKRSVPLTPARRSASPRYHFPFGPGPKMAELSATRSPRASPRRQARDEGWRYSASSSPPPSKPSVSEGWNVARSARTSSSPKRPNIASMVSLRERGTRFSPSPKRRGKRGSMSPGRRGFGSSASPREQGFGSSVSPRGRGKRGSLSPRGRVFGSSLSPRERSKSLSPRERVLGDNMSPRGRGRRGSLSPRGRVRGDMSPRGAVRKGSLSPRGRVFGGNMSPRGRSSSRSLHRPGPAGRGRGRGRNSSQRDQAPSTNRTRHQVVPDEPRSFSRSPSTPLSSGSWQSGLSPGRNVNRKERGNRQRHRQIRRRRRRRDRDTGEDDETKAQPNACLLM